VIYLFIWIKTFVTHFIVENITNWNKTWSSQHFLGIREQAWMVWNFFSRYVSDPWMFNGLCIISWILSKQIPAILVWAWRIFFVTNTLRVTTVKKASHLIHANYHVYSFLQYSFQEMLHFMPTYILYLYWICSWEYQTI
jgi:hypothetical protein